jgi:hypothetical protein
MSASARVVTAVVMASAIATAVALPAIVGGHGHAHVVAAPESAGRRTVRIEGPRTSSGTTRPRTTRRQPDVAARRMPHADARPALAAVSYRRPSTPRRPAAGRPPAARPRRHAPGTTPAPTPNPAPPPQAPTPTPPSATQPSMQPPSQPAAPVTQVQGRELASTAKPTPPPAPPPAPAPPPMPAPSPKPNPPPQPSPPPAPTPNPPPGRDDDQGHDDDRGARHQDERSRDDAGAESTTTSPDATSKSAVRG